MKELKIIENENYIEFDFEKMKSLRVCFGSFEDFDSSWHCKGCVLKSKCKLQKIN